MASEAQRLIGISLTKIAQSKTHRGGISLHKNLLVATVLQKARYIFMEEAYNIMIHYNKPKQQQQQQQNEEQDDEIIEEGHDNTTTTSIISQENLTYYDLDRNTNNNPLKRRRSASSSSSTTTISEDFEECEEIVQSILSKRCKQDDDDSVFLDDTCVTSSLSTTATATATTATTTTTTTTTTDLINDNVTSQCEQQQDLNNVNGNMEIDRITSLVSIFSFSMGADGRINRSSGVPTPDLCAAQATKDTTGGDSLQQQRTFLAMTV